MQNVIPNGDSLASLQAISKTLKDSRLAKAKAEKAEEAAKEALAKWLLDERGINIDALESGEIVIVKDVAMIEIKVQQRFDEKGFSLAEPDIHVKWIKPRPMKLFKPLVS